MNHGQVARFVALAMLLAGCNSNGSSNTASQDQPTSLTGRPLLSPPRRLIARIAMFEMVYRKDIPPVVSINEAIDLSKQFSNADAKRFINGILDRLKDQLGRDARKAD